VAGDAEVRVRVLGQALLDEPAHPVLAQRTRLDGDGGTVVHDLGEQRRIGAGLGRAQRGRHQHRQPLEAADQVGDEAQRRPVDPVQVVEQQDHGALGGGVDHEPVEAVEGGERDVARCVAGLVDRLEDRSRGAGRAAQPRVVRLPIHECRLEQLAHDPEGELALELAALRHQHAHPGRLGTVAKLGQQPALPDSRLPLDQRQPAVAVLGAAQQALELLHLTGAFEERCVPAAQWSATVPPSGSSGRPRSTQAWMPPVRL
jgi:hypothetical protein